MQIARDNSGHHALPIPRRMKPTVPLNTARVPDELDPGAGRAARFVLREEEVDVDVLNARLTCS